MGYDTMNGVFMMFDYPIFHLLGTTTAVQNTNALQGFYWPPVVIVGCLLLLLLLIGIVIVRILYLRIGGGIIHYGMDQIAEDETWQTSLGKFGFAYEPRQDLFYSLLNAWQRGMGYCRLYDEGAAPLSMIIDCEPIRFEYGNKRWLVEFWKGQYGMTTGGELGVYSTTMPDLDIPNVFNGTFYECQNDSELLPMSFTLIKNGKPLFKRDARHWWLTGFLLGEFTQPSELTMHIQIAFRSRGMAAAFANALKDAGYAKGEYAVRDNLVRVIFSKPHTAQPLSRVKFTDWLTQRKNRVLCKEYQKLTEGYSTTDEKIQAIRLKSPTMYRRILLMGKSKPLFADYDFIKNYTGNHSDLKRSN